MKEIYLDWATSNKPDEEVIKAFLPYLKERWGSPLAPYERGQKLLTPFKEALVPLYELVGASSEDRLIFTSTGAEAVQQALLSIYLEVSRKEGKNQFITTLVEEAPTHLTLCRLEELGCIVERASTPTLEGVKELITPRTALVSLSWANGLTGAIHPIFEIASYLKERGIRLHVEASHTIGKLGLAFAEGLIDYLTFTGEAIQALGGALFVKQGAPLSPLILGEPTPLYILAALSKGAELALQRIDTYLLDVGAMRDDFEEKIGSTIEGSYPLFREERRVPHISAMHFPRVTADALNYLLNKKGIAASFGGGKFQKLSYLPEAGLSSLSFSFSHLTREEEVVRAIDLIAESYRHLRKAAL